MDKFEKDFDSDVVREKILKDLEDGNKAGLKVTPTFFINGTRFDGALSVDEFSREIDSRL
jgi:protein-disulfide isomerase